MTDWQSLVAGPVLTLQRIVPLPATSPATWGSGASPRAVDARGGIPRGSSRNKSNRRKIPEWPWKNGREFGGDHAAWPPSDVEYVRKITHGVGGCVFDLTLFAAYVFLAPRARQ